MTPSHDTGQPLEKILVADLPDGKRVRTYFLCAKKETPTTQKGATYLRMTLRDASGELTAINWDPDTMLLAGCEEGDVCEAEGKFKVHEKYGPQLYVDSLRRLDEGQYDSGTLVAVSPVATGDLDARLAAVLAAVTQAPLRTLLSLTLDTTREPGATFAVVPAAIRNHHAYRHGLLEHSVIVAETALRVGEEFANVDRSLLVTGALLHDIGKTRAYSADPMATGMTDEGILLGEIVAGLEIVRGLISETPAVSPATAQLLLHIIASHHGEREKGSPIVPQTREAVIVHYCDDMTARVAAIDEAARKAPEGSRWTPQRVGMLGVAAFLGEGGPAEEVDEEVFAEGDGESDEDFGVYGAVDDPGAGADDPGDVTSGDSADDTGPGPETKPANDPAGPLSDAESAELGRLFDDA